MRRLVLICFCLLALAQVALGADEGLLTLDLPSMNLRDALMKVDPTVGESFAATERVSPEVSFYKFPKELASEVLIFAAGGSKLNAAKVDVLPDTASAAAFRKGGAQDGEWVVSLIANEAKLGDALSALSRVTRSPIVGSTRGKDNAEWIVTTQILNVSLDAGMKSVIPSPYMTYTLDHGICFISPLDVEYKALVKRLNSSAKKHHALSMSELSELAVLGKERRESVLTALKDSEVAGNARNIVNNNEDGLLLFASLSKEERLAAESERGLSNAKMTDAQKLLLYKLAHGTTEGMRPGDLERPSTFSMMIFKGSWEEFSKLSWKNAENSSFGMKTLRCGSPDDDAPTTITVLRVSGASSHVSAFSWSGGD